MILINIHTKVKSAIILDSLIYYAERTHVGNSIGDYVVLQSFHENFDYELCYGLWPSQGCKGQITIIHLKVSSNQIDLHFQILLSKLEPND